MYQFSGKLKTLSIILTVVGLIGIGYSFYSAPSSIEDAKEILAHQSSHGDDHGSNHDDSHENTSHETSSHDDAHHESSKLIMKHQQTIMVQHMIIQIIVLKILMNQLNHMHQLNLMILI